jgi:hypothetical protein
MSMFRKSGGSTGVIQSVGFSTKEWDGDNGPYSTLSFDFTFLIDGGTEPVNRFLNAGFLNDGVSVNDDGTLSVEEEGQAAIGENTEFARFIGSLVEQGFPEANLDPNGLDWSALVGTRLTLTQWVDEEATKKFGTRKSKKNGKEYKRSETRVGKLLGMPGETKTAAPAKGKAAPKATAAKGAAKGAAKKQEAADTTAADNAIVEILGDAKDNTVLRGAISMAVVKYCAKNKMSAEEREPLRKQLADEAYLADATERGVIKYDGAAKGQPITLA